jgi:hypothetical protein
VSHPIAVTRTRGRILVVAGAAALLALPSCGDGEPPPTARELADASAPTTVVERRAVRALPPGASAERRLAPAQRIERPPPRVASAALSIQRQPREPVRATVLRRPLDLGPGAHYALDVELELFGGWPETLAGELSLIRCRDDGPDRGSLGVGAVRIEGLPAEFESEIDRRVELDLLDGAVLTRTNDWSPIALRQQRVSGLVRVLSVEVEKDDGDVASVRERRLRIEPSEPNEIVPSPDGPCPDELVLHLVLEELVGRYAAVEVPEANGISVHAANEHREELGRATWFARRVSDTPEIIDPEARRAPLVPRLRLEERPLEGPDRLRKLEAIDPRPHGTLQRTLRSGYPPDKQEKATQTVLEQAEVLSEVWAA